MSRADELAVELEWSRSEVRELKARLAATEHERDAARANAGHEANDVVALRAIIEGRTVPPTDAEIAAHHAAGGRWRCLVPNRLWQSNAAMHASTARIQRATLEVDGGPAVWWSIDSTGRPCAWPVVPPKDGAQ